MKIILKMFIYIGVTLYSFCLKAQDIVDVKVDGSTIIGELNPFWASQIIHPSEFLLTSWGDRFIQLLEESGAARQFIRVYNQPEKAIKVDGNGEISYDWNHFDIMANKILSSGNKPHVVFFSMPKELALHKESTLKRPYGAIVNTSPPIDYKEWENLCSDFTRHVIEEFGIEEVRTWSFRCWNEPDLGGFWYKADLGEYLKLYDYFAKGVKDVDDQIRIGGPALSTTRTYKEPDNFKFFLEHIVNGKNFATGQIGSPIDFLSVHTYGGTGGHGGVGRDFTDVDYMIEQQIRYANMRDGYSELKDLPIYVEEWGISASGGKGVRDEPMTDVRNSEYGSAFLTALVSKEIQMKLENDRKIERHIFCSSGYETIPEYDFMGYRTLDTKNGFHKPILNAYRLLDRLGRHLISVKMDQPDNNVFIVASKNAEKVTIMITNYQFEEIQNEGFSKKINLSVKFPWFPEDRINVNHWRIDRDHSNAYTAFKDLGSPELPNPIEIDYIKGKMGLERITFDEGLVQDMDQMEIELPCNGVSLIEIVRN